MRIPSDDGRQMMLFANVSQITALHMRSMAVVASFGRGAFLTQSHKVRPATILSCESELCGASDAIVECLWLTHLAKSLCKMEGFEWSIRIARVVSECLLMVTSAKRTRFCGHSQRISERYVPSRRV